MSASESQYTVGRTAAAHSALFDWDGPAWQDVEALEIAHFQSNSAAHRPRTQLKLQYNDEQLHGLFRVDDRYVICTHLSYQSDVYMDSCVEAFLMPQPRRGYFSFEMNCGGALLAYHIEDPTPLNDRFVKYTAVPWSLGRTVTVRTSLGGRIEPEIAEPVTWYVEFAIPFAYFESMLGPLGPLQGQNWRAQFNKCAFGCSHPHGAAWADLGGVDSFHQPERFGTIVFA